MMTELATKQQKFVLLTARLILWAYSKGYALTYGETYRTPEQAAINARNGAGILHSLHTDRLAVDFNLFKDGIYQDKTEQYKVLGDYWKSLDPDCAWGGDFTTRQDGNHFSIAYQGRK